MDKYKAGDKVRIRRDLKEGEYYGDFLFTDSMLPYIGTKVEIFAVGDRGLYEIKEDGCLHAWSEEMFEEEISAPENTPVFPENEEDILFLSPDGAVNTGKNRREVLRRIGLLNDNLLALLLKDAGCNHCTIFSGPNCNAGCSGWMYNDRSHCYEKILSWLREE